MPAYISSLLESRPCFSFAVYLWKYRRWGILRYVPSNGHVYTTLPYVAALRVNAVRLSVRKGKGGPYSRSVGGVLISIS